MNETAFLLFLKTRHRDLQRISRHTRGESSVEDVQAEAWLLIGQLESKGQVIDLAVVGDQTLIISYLYQQLVRYVEQTVRNAVRLDHSPGGDDGAAHPLAYLLAAAEHYDPLVALMSAEEKKILEINPHTSLAAAYLGLLAKLNNSMPAMAEHLMISLSYCYQRCAHARLLAVWQSALPAIAMVAEGEFVPGAWRRFRLRRKQMQLAFDFEWGRGLFAAEP